MGYADGRMSFLGYIGSGVLARWSRLTRLAAITWAVLLRTVRPRTWTAPLRNVLARQVLFTGFEATGFIALIAVIVGALVVVQAQYWLTRLGQSNLIGPILTAVVLRELGPLLTNFVVIARSGTAIATELANMKVHGEVRALDAMGIDPFVYLVVPRVLGVAISTFCLTIIFLAVTFIGGFACIWAIELGDVNMGLFFGNIIGSVTVPVTILPSSQEATTLSQLRRCSARDLLTTTMPCSSSRRSRSTSTSSPAWTSLKSLNSLAGRRPSDL